MVLGDDYSPPSPLREVAANRSVDQLAPENPIAAEMAQIRETLEAISAIVIRRNAIPRGMGDDILILRTVLEANIGYLDEDDLVSLVTPATSSEHDVWVEGLRKRWEEWREKRARSQEDPWASDNNRGGYSDEPPF